MKYKIYAPYFVKWCSYLQMRGVVTAQVTQRQTTRNDEVSAEDGHDH